MPTACSLRLRFHDNVEFRAKGWAQDLVVRAWHLHDIPVAHPSLESLSLLQINKVNTAMKETTKLQISAVASNTENQ